MDDVITAGTAIRESMELISANKAELAAVLIALNRKERGKGELSAIQEVERDYQCQVLSIIDLDDLMQFIEQVLSLIIILSEMLIVLNLAYKT